MNKLVTMLVMLVLCVGLPQAHAKKNNNQSNELGSGNGQPFQTLRGMINTLASDPDEAVAQLQNSIDTVEAQLQAQVDDLADVQTTHTQLLGAIQAAASLLEQRVSANEMAISQSQSDIALLDDQVATLFALDSFQSQLISALQADVAGLQAQISANDSDIATLINADAAMQQLIKANQQRINTLQSLITLNALDISAAQSDINQAEADIVYLRQEVASKQDLITGACSPGYSIRRISSSGVVTCERDDVSAGVGTLDTLAVERGVELPGAGITVGVAGVFASCPGAYRVTGGGHQIYQISDFGDVRLIQMTLSRSVDNGFYAVGWNDNIVAFGNGRVGITAFANCARVI